MREQKSLQYAATNRERSEYLKERGWKWTVINPNPPVKSEQAKRRLFRDREDQLLRPTVTVYRE